MTNTSQELGRRGEEAAVAFLESKGIEIVDQNWKCSYGEVDIIALDDHTLVFCEVKTRRSDISGLPDEAITLAKQKRYSRIAKVYTSRTETTFDAVRFDVISIYQYSDSQALLRYIRNAFPSATDE